MSEGMSLVELLRRNAIAREQELEGADVEAQKTMLAKETYLVITYSIKFVAT